MSSGINAAMLDDRAEKRVVRQLWVEAVKSSAIDADQSSPLYLTLPGAAGGDIAELVAAGVLSLTENEAGILDGDMWKVVAVERSNPNSLALRRRYAGLKVITDDISGVLRSTGPTRWPEGEHEKFCRARVVNLDLNSALRAEHDGRVVFPTIQLVSKLATLHLKAPALDWVLCLTVAAQIDWDDATSLSVQAFLRENFVNEAKFAADSELVLGKALFDRICGSSAVSMSRLTKTEQQALLMVFVPKKIVAETYRQGWRIVTTHNLRYGAHPAAAMVTWIMKFHREPRVSDEPAAVYTESLEAALAGAGHIGPDGQVKPPHVS